MLLLVLLAAVVLLDWEKDSAARAVVVLSAKRPWRRVDVAAGPLGRRPRLDLQLGQAIGRGIIARAGKLTGMYALFGARGSEVGGFGSSSGISDGGRMVLHFRIMPSW